MSKWQTVTLKEAGVTLIDCDHKTPKAQTEGFPYVGIPQLKEGRISLDGARLITEDDFHHWRRKAKPTPHDVILSRRCNPGETAYVPDRLEIALGQNLVLLRSDGEKLHPQFLRWVVQGSNWWNQVGKFLNVGAVFDSLKCADIPKFEIQLPPMESQIKILEILESLDKKIEVNNQTNQTLEQIAQAIFKSWFVDFEPVRAKMAVLEAGGTAEQAELAAMSAISTKDEAALKQLQAEQPEADAQGSANVAGGRMPGATYDELAQTAALFPSAMEESELGEIPEGWKVGQAGKIYDVVIGKTPPRKESHWFSLNPDDIKWLSIKGMGNGSVFSNQTDELLTPEAIAKHKVKVSPAGTVFLSFKLTVGRVAIAGQNMATNEAIAHFRIADDTPSTAWTYLYLKQFDYAGLGSTSSIATAVNSKMIKAMPVLMPDEEVLKRFNKIVSSLFRSINLTERSSQNLSEIRDSLLPKLLSGDLPITNTEVA